MLKATLEQWRMFKAVADEGGFNQASVAVHKSQSSVHHAVHKLEQSLGLTLFETHGRRVKLTPQGSLMLRRANYLLDEANKLEAVASNLQSGTETVLRIAVDLIFPSDILYSVLSDVSKEFPLLRIEIEEAVLSGANALLQNGQVDLAISSFPLAEGFSEELCNIDFIAVAHHSHPLHHLGRELTVEDLKSHRQIVVRDSSIKRSADSGWLGADQRWTVSHVKTSIDIISRGLGFAWLPLAMIETHLNDGIVLPLPLKSGGIRHTTLFLNFDDGDCLGPAARSLIGGLRYKTLSIPEVSKKTD